MKKKLPSIPAMVLAGGAVLCPAAFRKIAVVEASQTAGPSVELPQTLASGIFLAQIAIEPDALNLVLDCHDDDLERELEQQNWNSRRALRRQRQQLAAQLASDIAEEQKRQSDDGHLLASGQAIELERSAVARIDERLEMLAVPRRKSKLRRENRNPLQLTKRE